MADPVDIETLIEHMDPDEKVRAAIRIHLIRQIGVKAGFVRLANGKIVKEGHEE